MNKVKRGGAGRGQGRHSLPEEELKKGVIFYVKQKHIPEAKKKIQPIIDKLNKKP